MRAVRLANPKSITISEGEYYDEKGRIQSFKRESTLEKIGSAQEQWIIDLIRSKRSSPQARAKQRGDNDVSGTLSSDKLKVVPRERFRHKKVGRLVDTDSAAVASESVDASPLRTILDS